MGNLSDADKQTCKELEVDNRVLELAVKLHDLCPSTSRENLSEGDGVRKLGFACLLYISAKARSASSSLQPCLNDIVKAFELSVAEFLQELPVLVKEAQPQLVRMFGAEVESKVSVRELQTVQVHSSVLARKAKDLHEQFIGPTTLPSGVTAPSFDLLWLLFITAKAELLHPFPDLVTAFNLLILCTDYVLGHAAQSNDDIDFLDRDNFPVQAAPGIPDTLASIVLHKKTNLNEVKALKDSVYARAKEIFGQILPADPEFQFPDQVADVRRAGFSGLLQKDNAELAIRTLSDRYNKVFKTVSEIDERSFISREDTETANKRPRDLPVPTPPSLTKCVLATPHKPIHSLTAATPVRLLRTPLRPANQLFRTPSPVKLAAPSYFATPGGLTGTPLSESMQLTAWLRTSLEKYPAHPSEELNAFFKSCDPSVGATITKRVEELSKAVFPVITNASAVAFLQSTHSNQRREQGVKLYYRVLETMLKAEQANMGKSNFTALLNNATFHKCLLACSFEMIAASYRMASLTFPAVLDKLDLKAFDLCKMIESFVRYEIQLPRELKRHLFHIEEKMLESLAWNRGSSLYPKLISACSDAPAAAASGAEAPKSPHKRPSSEELQSPNKHRRGSSADGLSPRVGQDTTHSESEDGPPKGTPQKRERPRAAKGDSDDDSPPKLHKGGRDRERSVTPELRPGSDHHATDDEVCEGSNSMADASQPVSSDAPSGIDGPHVRDGSPPKTPSRRLKPTFQGLDHVSGSLATPTHRTGKSAFQAFMSPLRPTGDLGGAPGFGPLPTAFGDPTQHLQRPGRNVVAEFLKKVLRLALLRATDLCDRLDFNIPEHQDIDVIAQVYTMLQHVIYNHTNLMYNRHLDQIILSALYSVCKVNGLKEISFKEIIQRYKKQPQAKTDIFRTAVIDQTEPDMIVTKTGDIIEFYNQIFIPTVKTFVLRLGQRKIQLAELPAMGAGAARRALMSPGPIPSHAAGLMTPPPASKLGPGTSPIASKVFISPLRQSPKQPFIAPHTKMIYVGRMGESAHAYQSPSKDLKYINGRIQAHSLQPPTAQSPAGQPEQVTEVRKRAGSTHRASSSDHSSTTERTTQEEDPSQSNSGAVGHSQSQSGHRTRSQLSHSQSPIQNGREAIDAMARAAAMGRGSRLEDLHNAAIILGSQEEEQQPDIVINGVNVRRSRRQAGYHARH